MWKATCFVEYMNSNDMNLKCTNSTLVTNFLDVTLECSVSGGVKISPFRKNTATNSILMATSCHTEHVIKNVPVGELIRKKTK